MFWCFAAICFLVIVFHSSLGLVERVHTTPAALKKKETNLAVNHGRASHLSEHKKSKDVQGWNWVFGYLCVCERYQTGNVNPRAKKSGSRKTTHLERKIVWVYASV
jgi:hypothetical protein